MRQQSANTGQAKHAGVHIMANDKPTVIRSTAPATASAEPVMPQRQSVVEAPDTTAEDLAAVNAELVRKIAEMQARMDAPRDNKGLFSGGLTNVLPTLDGSILTFRIDLAQRHGMSSGGKSTTVATCHGNRTIRYNGEEIEIGTNAFVKLPRSQWSAEAKERDRENRSK